MAGRTQQAGVRIEIDEKSISQLRATLRALGDKGAPFLRAAMEDVGRLAAGAVKSRAPGAIGGKVDFARTTGTGASTSAKVVVSHPGARSMEFGRKFYPVGYTRRGGKNVGGAKTGHLPGQKAKPFIGILAGGHAVGAIEDEAREKIIDAINQEWERLSV